MVAMPKRTDIQTILVIGSGPIVIGQGCEFDYSGVQACKALHDQGYRVVLVNSNPATIMTDPELAERTYVEPVTPEAIRKVMLKEAELGFPISALLQTLGGQTALNAACELWDNGTLEELNIEMIGATREVIRKAEDRQAFKEVCQAVGLEMPASEVVHTLDEAVGFLDEIGLPAIIRPAFTLGGSGGGVAYNREEFEDIVRSGLHESMIGQVQIDASVLGWKEYELEVVRDKADNCIIVCSIENIDPMGVHTGDSITVAPALTLTDREYQTLRDASLAIVREVGVDTGGSNVQFAVSPETGQVLVVEMNPRVSRSSALASKATGFPIAKIAALLAVGYTLDELRNDVTGTTSACFEPSIDYIVTKMPRWTFEKFPEADETLTTQMKSVGEAMAIGRTFKESFQKAIRSMEVKRFGFGLDRTDKWLAHKRKLEAGFAVDDDPWPIPEEKLVRKLAVPSQGRMYYIRYAFKLGWSLDRIHDLTRIDPFFLDEFKQLVEFEDELCEFSTLEEIPRDTFEKAKRLGYSDPQLANLYLHEISDASILAVRARRKELGITPVYKLVDTCAAEFEAITPYYYSTYETPTSDNTIEDEVRVSDRKKVIILGGGPNRIGQGIEFDYCCVHAAFAARDAGFESVMINSNPRLCPPTTTPRISCSSSRSLSRTHLISLKRSTVILATSTGSLSSSAGRPPSIWRTASLKQTHPSSALPSPRSTAPKTANTSRRSSINSPSTSRKTASRTASTKRSRSPMNSATPCLSAQATFWAGEVWRFARTQPRCVATCSPPSVPPTSPTRRSSSINFSTARPRLMSMSLPTLMTMETAKPSSAA